MITTATAIATATKYLLNIHKRNEVEEMSLRFRKKAEVLIRNEVKIEN